MPTQAELYAQAMGIGSPGGGGAGPMSEMTDADRFLAAQSRAPAPPVPNKPNLDALPGTMDLLGAAATGARKAILPYEQPSDIIQGPAELVKHPIDSIGMLLESMVGAHKDQASKAKEALGGFKGIRPGMDPSELMSLLQAGGHGLAAAVPLVGPAVAGGVEQVASGIGSGDPVQAFEGGGGLLAMLAQGLLGKTKGKAPAALEKTPPRTTLGSAESQALAARALEPAPAPVAAAVPEAAPPAPAAPPAVKAVESVSKAVETPPAPKVKAPAESAAGGLEFAEGRGEYQQNTVDGAYSLVEAARKSGKVVTRHARGADIADGFISGTKVISYVDKTGKPVAGAFINAEGLIADVGQLDLGGSAGQRVLVAAIEAGGKLSDKIRLAADSIKLIDNTAAKIGVSGADIRSGKLDLHDVLLKRAEYAASKVLARAKRRRTGASLERPGRDGGDLGTAAPAGAGVEAGVEAGPQPVAPKPAAAPAVGSIEQAFAKTKLKPKVPIEDTVGKTKLESLPDVPMLKSERTGSRAAGFLEKAVESSFPGAKAFDKFRGRQQAALIDDMAEQATKNISKFKGTREELGARVIKELEQSKETLKANASIEYAAIDADAAGVKVPTGELKMFASGIAKELKELSKISPAGDMTKTIALIESIRDAPKRVKFKTMQDFRSNLLGRVRMIREEIPGRADGITKKIADLADRAMVDGAKESGNAPLMERVRSANAKWKDMNESFNESVIKQMLNKAPEKVPDLLRTASLDDIRRVRRTLPDNTFQDIKAHVLRQMLDDATQGELSVRLIDKVEGFAKGEPAQGGRKLQGGKLRAALEKFGEDKLREVYTKDEIGGILKVVETAEKVGAPPKSLIGAFINGRLFYAAGKAAAGISHGDFTGVIEPVAMYAGIRVMSKMMTRKGGSSTIANYLSALAKANEKLPAHMRFKVPPANNTAAAKFWGARVAQMAKLTPQNDDEKP